MQRFAVEVYRDRFDDDPVACQTVRAVDHEEAAGKVLLVHKKPAGWVRVEQQDRARAVICFLDGCYKDGFEYKASYRG